MKVRYNRITNKQHQAIHNLLKGAVNNGCKKLFKTG